MPKPGFIRYDYNFETGTLETEGKRSSGSRYANAWASFDWSKIRVMALGSFRSQLLYVDDRLIVLGDFRDSWLIIYAKTDA